MSGSATKRMLRAYIQETPVTMFLTSFFVSPPENFYSGESVEIDIERDDEDIAIAITDLSTGSRVNSDDLYTNKEFKPPILGEASPLNSFDLIKRMSGQDPFQNPDFQANAIIRAFKSFRKNEKKIRRTIELQASQVLQTGVITLTDKTGAAVYTLDFKPKATHFPTVGTSWSDPGADPLADLDALGEVIRSDGKTDPTDLIMGRTAFQNFIRNAEVRAQFDNRRMDIGQIAPEKRDMGATLQGVVWVGNYQYRVWTYSGRYKDPQTGNITPYVADDKVIMMSEGGRLDLTFGAIPMIAPPDSRVLPFLPSRVENADGRIDLHSNAWLTPDGKQLMVDVGSRPLAIPTAIDTFGCLDTEI